MKPRVLRRIWFLGLWMLLPWPLSVIGSAFVPAVRYAILACASSSIALTEGAASPVGSIVALFVGVTLLTTLACWVIAWVIAKLLARLPLGYASAITWACLGFGLFVALLFEPYRTPFGRALTGGLLQVLS
jgi:hypothetical protein